MVMQGGIFARKTLQFDLFRIIITYNQISSNCLMTKNTIDKTAIVFWISLIGGVASILGLVVSLASPGEWQSKHIALSSAAYIIFLIGIELYILVERGKIVSARDTALRELTKIAAYRVNYESIHAISHACGFR
jgi:hypothetical protein